MATIWPARLSPAAGRRRPERRPLPARRTVDADSPYWMAKGRRTMWTESGTYTHAVVSVCLKSKVRFSIIIRQRAIYAQSH